MDNKLFLNAATEGASLISGSISTLCYRLPLEMRSGIRAIYSAVIFTDFVIEKLISALKESQMLLAEISSYTGMRESGASN